MKLISMLAVTASCLFPGIAYSENAFEKIALPMMKTAAYQSFGESEVNKECAVGATADFDKLATGRAGASSSSAMIASLLEKIENRRQELLVDSSHCGSCQQVNDVATFTTTEPEKTLRDASCDTMPTINIQKELPAGEIQSFAAATLQGKTDEGKKLYAGCPNPCSFHIATATTPLENQNSLLNLTVQCGQPRNGSILFAKYNYSSGLLHKWTCR